MLSQLFSNLVWISRLVRDYIVNFHFAILIVQNHKLSRKEKSRSLFFGMAEINVLRFGSGTVHLWNSTNHYHCMTLNQTWEDNLLQIWYDWSGYSQNRQREISRLWSKFRLGNLKQTLTMIFANKIMFIFFLKSWSNFIWSRLLIM